MCKFFVNVVNSVILEIGALHTNYHQSFDSVGVFSMINLVIDT